MIHHERAGGFSLIELLIVMALILILYTILYAPSSKAYQTQQKELCARNLRNAYTALRVFAQDHQDAFPSVTNAVTSESPLSLLIPRYTTGTEFFICPGSSDKPLPDATPFADRRISYAYYMGRKLTDGAGKPVMSDAQINTLQKFAGQFVFSRDGKKPGNNHNRYGGNFLFCDGAIEASPAKSAFNLSPPTNVILLNPRP
jgi:prepilin-type N-terminal cleavage/methylation domain-containing protein/prepilin-type processing-associated H-X9-DG protein